MFIYYVKVYHVAMESDELFQFQTTFAEQVIAGNSAKTEIVFPHLPLMVVWRDWAIGYKFV